MDKLNLPQYAYKIKKRADGILSIYDEIRRRYVALTPEEWVRQHFVHYLTDYLHYPSGCIGNEVSIRLNGQSRRCDSVVYDGGARPIVIVEYKAPQVAITQKVFTQITHYNMVLRVDYLIVSNGLRHIACRMDYDHNTYTFLDHIPMFEELK